MRPGALAATVALGAALSAALACSPADVKEAEVTGFGDGGNGGDGGLVDSGGPIGTGPCALEAYARCSRIATCSESVLEARYGSVEACEASFTASCINIMNAPSSGQSAAQIEACTAVIPTEWACDDILLTQNIPPACQTPMGGLANGTSCVASAQCQSAFCRFTTGALCGTCQPSPVAGDSCATSNCSTTLTCEPTTKTCESYSQIGAVCSDSQPCALGLTCTAGVTGSSCQSGVITANTSCVYSGPGCDFSMGLACNIETGTCQMARLVAPGGACGGVDGQQAYCTAGTCVRGSCVAYAGVGQACDTVAGPSCLGSTRCVLTGDGGTAGTCVIDGAGACP